VWHPGLLHKLRTFGISDSLHDWFSSYLTGRSQKVVIGGEESTIKYTNAGVPQGSILGPLLFLIFINDIVDDLENEIFLFADDASLMNIFEHLLQASASINRDLQRLSNWATTWRVTFSPVKSTFMLISRKQTKSKPIIRMDNKEIEQVNHMNYLGITLTSNMSWNIQIEKMSSKASKRIGLLFKMKDKLPRSAKMKYYVSFIRPILEYGNVLYDNCTAHESHTIELVQRRAALLCTGTFKRTPSNALLYEVGWEKLEIRRYKAKITLLYKIINGLTPPYLRNLIPPRINATTAHNLRNQTDFRIPLFRTSQASHSFIPSTLKIWNSLDPQIKNCSTLSSFKSKIKYSPNPMTKLYSLFYGFNGKYLTQMRLGLSKLKMHLFTYNIVPEPYCQNCPQRSNETACHYLLECPAFAAHRLELLRDLRGLLLPATLNNHILLNHILLHGDETMSFVNNRSMFTAVLTYIENSGRFS
jgi:hypothetical protein